MSSKLHIIFTALATICLICSIVAPVDGKEVTNEEIRDAVLSLVQSYHILENKLDRHEQRERALGEMLKKGLSNLQRGQKAYEPMIGSFSRLEDRFAQIESVLLAQEEKAVEKNDKFTVALEAVLQSVNDHRPVDGVAEKRDSSEEDDSLGKKIGDLSDSVRELRNQIAELRADKENAETSNKFLLEQSEKLVNSKLASADEVISRLEEKMSHFYITGPATTPAPHNSEWEKEINEALVDIKSFMSGSHGSATLLSVGAVAYPDKQFIQGLFNETLEAIEDMRLEVLTASDKSFAKTASRIKETNQALENSITEVIKTVGDQAMASESFNTDMQKQYEQIQTSMQALAKIEKIVLDSADNILDTKKKVEFSIHEIVFDTGAVVRAGTKELNETINKRFNEIDETILDNHHGSLTNLSSKIETEISQVWRQIGIMYQEISSSKQSLDKLQQLSELYVNGTLASMDGMEGKVSLITARMSEVDSNLNYLLGRLSLVTQEFNQIKHGLGSALDNIRSSFMIVQSKVKDVGPGPHQIPSDENETDYLGPAPAVS